MPGLVNFCQRMDLMQYVPQSCMARLHFFVVVRTLALESCPKSLGKIDGLRGIQVDSVCTLGLCHAMLDRIKRPTTAKRCLLLKEQVQVKQISGLLSCITSTERVQ